jgi:hypothetical protein
VVKFNLSNLFQKQTPSLSWAEKRKNMDFELKQVVVPVLRAAGFQGSFPHFRRVRDEVVDVLGFQFSQYGPQFYVEAGRATLDRIQPSTGYEVDPKKIKHHHVARRVRLGPQPPVFDFETTSPTVIANAVLQYLPDAERYWTEGKTPAETGPGD